MTMNQSFTSIVSIRGFSLPVSMLQRPADADKRRDGLVGRARRGQTILLGRVAQPVGPRVRMQLDQDVRQRPRDLQLRPKHSAVADGPGSPDRPQRPARQKAVVRQTAVRGAAGVLQVRATHLWCQGMKKKF